MFARLSMIYRLTSKQAELKVCIIGHIMMSLLINTNINIILTENFQSYVTLIFNSNKNNN